MSVIEMFKTGLSKVHGGDREGKDGSPLDINMVSCSVQAVVEPNHS